MVFMAVGNEELGKDLGKKVKCPKCKKLHAVKYGDEVVDGKRLPCKMLGYVKCGKDSYLVGINGKEITR